MSAPRTNVEKQERRHKPALTALRGLIVLAALILIGFVALQVTGGGETPDAGLLAPAGTE